MKLSEIAPNFAHFSPQFLGGGPLEFFHQDYKIEHTSDHVATFHSDRPMIGAFALKKRKETDVKHKTYGKKGKGAVPQWGLGGVLIS